MKKILPLLLGLIVGIAGTFLYFTKFKHIQSQKADFYVLQTDRKANTQFSCKQIQAATVFPENNLDNENFIKLEGSLSQEEGSSIAIDVQDKTLKFLTDTSVESGMMEPAEFTVMKNNDVRIIAVGVTSGSLKDVSSVNTFILDKKTGSAVWTKASESSLIPNIPNAQAYYYSCN